MNCNDDLGILQGKWQGSYEDGKKPTDWSGSADILQQWLSSNCKPVKYGQCWVFGAVLCSGDNIPPPCPTPADSEQTPTRKSKLLFHLSVTYINKYDNKVQPNAQTWNIWDQNGPETLFSSHPLFDKKTTRWMDGCIDE